jgi:hypothetical protein
MARSIDIAMADVSAAAQTLTESDFLNTPHSDAFAFSDLEKRVLDLYDQLRDLELQKSLLEAQESGTPSYLPY